MVPDGKFRLWGGSIGKLECHKHCRGGSAKQTPLKFLTAAFVHATKELMAAVERPAVPNEMTWVGVGLLRTNKTARSCSVSSKILMNKYILTAGARREVCADPGAEI